MSVRPTAEQEQRSMLFCSNRWVNSIYPYSIQKQKIFLCILEQFQPEIDQIRRGKARLHQVIKLGQDVVLQLDMSQIAHYNNYHQVRKSLQQMCSDPVQICTDPHYQENQAYAPAPLLRSWEPHEKDRRIALIRIPGPIVERLVHIDPKPGTSKVQNYTKFDKESITDRKTKTETSTKYLMPLYLLICSFASKGGLTITVEELRRRMGCDEKYMDYHNFHRFVLRHVQKELQIFGSYGYNFEQIKTGKRVTSIKFKIFANKEFDYNHVWLRLQRALQQELPYYVRFTEEQRAQFNYLLTSKHDLDKVYSKFQYIHKQLLRYKEAGEPRKQPFAYTLKAIQEQFPPG